MSEALSADPFLGKVELRETDMAGFFRAPDRRQRYLLPVDMMDWLPSGDIVHWVVDAVELMDLSAFGAEHRVGGAGQVPFAPKVLLALLIYACSQGVRSSRKIERLCERDAGYRLIVGEQVPDHTVIARFRRRHSARMAEVFRHVLKMCHKAGLVRLRLVALDGTKVQANAALDANRTAESIDAQIQRMMDEAETSDRQEDDRYGAERGDEVPADLRSRQERLARLKACQQRLQQDAEGQAARHHRRSWTPGRLMSRPGASASASASAAASPRCRITASIRRLSLTRPVPRAGS